MSGVKGRSGGARPGAGRKPGLPQTTGADGGEPLAFLLDVMRDVGVDARLRVRAAVAAAQYCHVKLGDAGKKNDRQKAADVAGAGKFARAAAPKLVVNNH